MKVLGIPTGKLFPNYMNLPWKYRFTVQDVVEGRVFEKYEIAGIAGLLVRNHEYVAG